MSVIHHSLMRLPGGWQLPPFGIHQVLALVIVAVALWSVGIIWLALQGGEQWVGTWQDEIKVHVYVDRNQQETMATLQENIMDIDGVDHVRLVSDEETQAWMEKWLGGEGLDAVSFSQHLPASLEVMLEEPRVATVLDDIQDVALAQGAEINEDELELVEAGDVLGTIQNLAWFATTILALAMALIVSNTLRMILLARAEEVHLMRLMGAKEWFVRLPFVLEGVLLGVGAGFTAWLLMWPLVWFTYDWQSNIGIDLSGWMLFLPLIFGGALVGGLGALIATTNIVSPETDS
ncbi:MAG: permease-like cell division protein FtsX [Ghiorsea sp.]|nr:permease-like cell division protein FtsX [Ghiorsea sp.]